MNPGRLGLLLVFAGVFFVSACSSRLVIDDYCLLAGPIMASEGDTPETLKQILEHNQTYAEICGN
jgi:hypothetical protein